MTARWPDREGWDAMAMAVETLAEACGCCEHCGCHAFCSQKYEYLRVDLQGRPRTEAQWQALHLLADLIEVASDRERESGDADRGA